MATQSKASAKKPAPKKAAKAKPAPKAKPAAKAKPAVKGKAVAKPVKKTVAKAHKATPKSAPKPASKPVSKAASKVVPAKTVPVKAAAGKGGPTKAAPKPAIAAAVPAAVLPPPKPLAPRPSASVNPKEIAAATEYLLTRSATRSGEPIVVNGKRLPTEEQLLKMPDTDYMNESQLAFFKYRLQQMERELMANADETTEHLRETVIVPDPADRATIEEEHALELRTRDRERKLLKKVQSSLAAIESGEYGYCEETGDPIGIPRLLARPTATLSLEAQQRREMKQRLFGD
jgi:DnaK suppressor protein